MALYAYWSSIIKKMDGGLGAKTEIWIYEILVYVYSVLTLNTKHNKYLILFRNYLSREYLINYLCISLSSTHECLLNFSWLVIMKAKIKITLQNKEDCFTLCAQKTIIKLGVRHDESI